MQIIGFLYFTHLDKARSVFIMQALMPGHSMLLFSAAQDTLVQACMVTLHRSCGLTLVYCCAAADATSSVAEEISAAVGKLTGEAKTNGDVYVSAVKKAAAKVRKVSQRLRLLEPLV